MPPFTLKTARTVAFTADQIELLSVVLFYRIRRNESEARKPDTSPELRAFYEKNSHQIREILAILQ